MLLSFASMEDFKSSFRVSVPRHSCYLLTRELALLSALDASSLYLEVIAFCASMIMIS
jgi:hypothetical protein